MYVHVGRGTQYMLSGVSALQLGPVVESSSDSDLTKVSFQQRTTYHFLFLQGHHTNVRWNGDTCIMELVIDNLGLDKVGEYYESLDV